MKFLPSERAFQRRFIDWKGGGRARGGRGTANSASAEYFGSPRWPFFLLAIQPITWPCSIHRCHILEALNRSQKSYQESTWVN